jgi:DNA polymerase III delta prime subunit
MAGLLIKKAVRYKAKMRLALYGPSGSGKTYTALAIAREVIAREGGRALVIDTERGSASLYADAFPGFEFDVIELASFHPHTYIEAIKLAATAKEYSVLIIDSATHEWSGSKGALETAGQNFVNWAKVTPLHNQFIDAMLDSPLHVIATMRAKEKFEMVKTVVDGREKSEVQKIGMEVIQGKDIQYEFNIVGSLDNDNTLTIQKTRCSELKGGVYPLPGKNVADIILPWLDGLPAPVRMATEDQLATIQKGHATLGKSVLVDLTALTYEKADALIAELRAEYEKSKKSKAAS